MKTTVVKWLAHLASLAGVALLVLAAGVQTAFAAVLEGAGGSVGPVTAVPAAGSSSALSVTGWIVVAAIAAAAALVGAWAVLRGRRRRAPAAAASDVPSLDTFCAYNPTSALCGP